nr:zinc finger, CCHC-type [Tanacetum cinerariifolium]
MASMNTRLNIKKLNGNIVQKHEGSKQVGLKQLDSKQVSNNLVLNKLGSNNLILVLKQESMEYRMKNMFGLRWNCRELKGIVKLRFFRLVTITLQWLKDEVYTTMYEEWGRQTFGCCRDTAAEWVEDTTRSTYLVNMSPSSAIGLKKPVDMLGSFGWLASIKQWILEPVKVKCIFLGYHKSVVGNKLWTLIDVTSKFEVELLGDHTFEVEPRENIDQGAGLQEVQTQDLIDYQLARDREQHLACELFGYREDSNEAAFAVAAVEKIYAHKSLTFNNIVACEAKIWATKGLLDKTKENVLSIKIVKDQSGYTLRVSQSRFYNEKLVQTLLEGHFILSLEGSLSEDCDVEKNDVGMLDKFDRELQTDVQVFVDFDYAMGRSITIMGEPRLLETTVGRTIPLLPIALDRAENELEATVDRLFNEGGSGHQTKQKDSAGGGQDANIQLVVEAADTFVEDAALMQSRRQKKRKSVVVDAGWDSHPPKKLREDHGTLSGAPVGGKSRYSLKRLLVGALLNAEVRVAAIPTLPFVTASVITTPEREDGDHTDSVVEPNLRTIGPPRRFVISSDSSHHSGTNVAKAEVDSLIRSFAPIMTTITITTLTVDPTFVTKEKVVEPSLFGVGSSSAGGTNPITCVFSDLTGSVFLVGATRTIINLDTDLQKSYFFASVREMEHDHLFTESNVRAARQMSLSAKDEANALRERNVILEKERDALDVKVTELATSAMSKECQLTDLNALVTSIKSQNDNLMGQ